MLLNKSSSSSCVNISYFPISFLKILLTITTELDAFKSKIKKSLLLSSIRYLANNKAFYSSIILNGILQLIKKDYFIFKFT